MLDDSNLVYLLEEEAQHVARLLPPEAPLAMPPQVLERRPRPAYRGWLNLLIPRTR
jgi:hypothetical protein